MRQIRHGNSSLNPLVSGRGRCVALVFACALPLGGCTTIRHDWGGPDKLKHFAASALIAAGSAHAAVEGGMPEGRARGVALGVTFVFGAGKEGIDHRFRTGYWSWEDMTWNFAGALLGSGLVLETR